MAQARGDQTPLPLARCGLAAAYARPWWRALHGRQGNQPRRHRGGVRGRGRKGENYQQKGFSV